MTKIKGRPTDFSDELAASICFEIAEGRSLRSVCRDKGMPHMSTIFRWLGEKDKATFKEQYARACEERTEAMAEDILDIADDGTNDYVTRSTNDGDEYQVVDKDNIQRSRLRVDTRKWLMSKMKPKKYGDKIDVTSAGERITQPPLIVSDVGAPVNEAQDKAS